MQARIINDADRSEPQVHWFASSFANWNADDDLAKLIRRQKSSDGKIAKGFNLWRVTGPCKETDYKILDYSPQHESALFVAFISY